MFHFDKFMRKSKKIKSIDFWKEGIYSRKGYSDYKSKEKLMPLIQI